MNSMNSLNSTTTSTLRRIEPSFVPQNAADTEQRFRPIPQVAASTFVVGIAAVAAGASLAVDVSVGTLEWPRLAAALGACAMTVGGVQLIRAIRMLHEGLAAISDRLGPIASLVAAASETRRSDSERGARSRADGAGSDLPDLDIESAAWVQILLVGVALIAVLIGTTSFPSRFPWQVLVPVAATAWPAVVRLWAARMRQAQSFAGERLLRERVAKEAIDRYVRS